MANVTSLPSAFIFDHRALIAHEYIKPLVSID